MAHLVENDACPYCWHQTATIKGLTGIGNYSIECLITHKGGNLDKHGTCNKCRWNFVLIKNCKNCNNDKACPECYASGYNGILDKDTPLVIHNLYMRNSPYKRSWDERARSIGEWYAKQVYSYMDAISILKRFTSNYKIQSDFNILERNITTNTTTNKSVFWNGLNTICLRYFSTGDDISVAINTFCCTLWQQKML